MSLILATLILAAPVSVVYVVNDPSVTLTTPVKFDLASAVASSFGDDIKPGTLDRYYCSARTGPIANKRAIDVAEVKAALQWSCVGTDSGSTVTDDQVLADVLGETNCKTSDTEDASERECRSQTMTADAKALHEAFLQAAFSKSLNVMAEMECLRDPKVPDKLDCGMRRIKVALQAVWRADRKAKKIFRTIGQVAP